MTDILYVGGSRTFADYTIIFNTLAALRPAALAVGCAIGADALTIRAASALKIPFHLFSITDPSGKYGWSATNPAITQAANRAATVVWLAGGRPAVPLKARLILRSKSALAISSSCLFFLSDPASPGSLAVASAAAAAFLPVQAFCPFGQPAPLAAVRGCWQPARPSFFVFQAAAQPVQFNLF